MVHENLQRLPVKSYDCEHLLCLQQVRMPHLGKAKRNDNHFDDFVNFKRSGHYLHNIDAAAEPSLTPLRFQKRYHILAQRQPKINMLESRIWITFRYVFLLRRLLHGQLYTFDRVNEHRW